jgi:hypothetical protein
MANSVACGSPEHCIMIQSWVACKVYAQKCFLLPHTYSACIDDPACNGRSLRIQLPLRSFNPAIACGPTLPNSSPIRLFMTTLKNNDLLL